VFDLRIFDTATGRLRFALPDDAASAGATSVTVGPFALRPDGRKLVVSAMEVRQPGGSSLPAITYALHAWDTTTGERLGDLGASAASLSRLEFSPDGARLAVVTGSGNQAVKIVDAGTGETVMLVNQPPTIGTIGALAFSHDGAALAAGLTSAAAAGAGGVSTVKLWSTADGRELWTAEVDRTVGQIALSPDGRHVVVALADRTLRIFDRTTGREKERLVGHAASISGLAFTPDGRRLISASADKTVRIWNLDTAPPPAIALEEARSSRSIQGAQVSRDRRILLARTTAPRPPANAPANSALAALGELADRLPDSVAAAITGAAIDIESWDMTTGRHLFAAPQPSNASSLFAISADGTRAALTRSVLVDTGTGVIVRFEADLLDPRSGKVLATLRQKPVAGTVIPKLTSANVALAEIGSASDLGLSSHGDRAGLVITTTRQRTNAGRGGMAGVSGEVEIWDATSGTPPVTISAPNMIVQKIAFSPDGRQVALITGTLSERGDAPTIELRLYDPSTGRMLRALQGSRDADRLVVFSPDGRWLAAPTANSSVTLWDTTTGERRFVLPGSRTVSSLAFSPDGTRLVSAGSDGTVTLWNAQSGNQILTLRPSNGPYTVREATLAGRATGAVSRTIAFSADGRHIILTTTTPGPTGVKIQIAAWDGSPRAKR
jgi:WD40 repeat protein